LQKATPFKKGCCYLGNNGEIATYNSALTLMS
jgi:hypothetical protein